MITHNSRSSSIRVRPQQDLSYLFSIQGPHRTSLTRSSDDSREQWRPVVSYALGWRRTPQTGDNRSPAQQFSFAFPNFSKISTLLYC